MRTAASVCQLLEQLETCVPTWMDEHHVPGLSLCMLRSGQTLMDRCFGVCSAMTQESVTAETLFEAASLTKPVFAAVALQLCDEGLLSLDNPLSSYLDQPYLPDDPRSYEITVRHVLSHTTGFPNWRKKDEALRTCFQPGSRFSYSGEGFVYLQAVVEQILGQGASEILKDRILDPLGSQHTAFVWAGDEAAQLAVGHNTQGEALAKKPRPVVNAAASMHCSAHDFARFMTAVMTPAADVGSLLSRETISEALSMQVPVNSLPSWHADWPDGEAIPHNRVGWGLGWGLQTMPSGLSLWHWGDNGCYQAFAVGEPWSGHGLVILTNGENGQRVIRRILALAIGSDIPALNWLDQLYGSS